MRQKISFSQKIENIQYNTAIAITGTFSGTLKLKLYDELCLECLKFRQWFRRLTTFYKLITTEIPH